MKYFPAFVAAAIGRHRMSPTNEDGRVAEAAEHIWKHVANIKQISAESF